MDFTHLHRHEEKELKKNRYKKKISETKSHSILTKQRLSESLTYFNT